MPAMQTEAGKAGHQSVLDRLEARTRKVRKWCLWAAGCTVLGASVLVAAYQNTPLLDSHAMSVFLVFSCLTTVVFVVGAFGIRYSSWSEADYYTVPGSRDAEGEHRCIHCGNRGIYRQGEYKTNNTYASCSKCKKSLWSS